MNEGLACELISMILTRPSPHYRDSPRFARHDSSCPDPYAGATAVEPLVGTGKYHGSTEARGERVESEALKFPPFSGAKVNLLRAWFPPLERTQRT